VKRRKYKRPLRTIDRRCTKFAECCPDFGRVANACWLAHPWYDTFNWDDYS